jgi:hypothetical protein
MQGAFRHHPVDGERELTAIWSVPISGTPGIAPPRMGEELVGIVDGGLAAFDGYVHGVTPRNRGGAGQARDAAA